MASDPDKKAVNPQLLAILGGLVVFVLFYFLVLRGGDEPVVAPVAPTAPPITTPAPTCIPRGQAAPTPAIDPATGQPATPAAPAPGAVDPATGQPATPGAVDPATGQPGPPAAPAPKLKPCPPDKFEFGPPVRKGKVRAKEFPGVKLRPKPLANPFTSKT